MMIKPAYAKQIPLPTPSVSQFTLKFVDNSYDVPPTYGIDQNTGQNVTIQAGYHVENKSTVVMIENQPFTPTTDPFGIYRMYYNVRVKEHNGNNWEYYYNYENSSNDYILASSSVFTVLVFGLSGNNGSDYYRLYLANIPDGGEADFQVQTFFGYSHNGDFESVQTSNWSNTKTITIPETSTSASASPSPTSTVPEFSWLTILPLLLTIPIAMLYVGKGYKKMFAKKINQEN